MNSIHDLTIEDIHEILLRAKTFKNDTPPRNIKNIMKEKIFGLLFFEPSTRTSMSFESGVYRLGGKVIKYNADFSSERKGESIEDTIRTIDAYVDAFIIRHPEKNFISRISRFTDKPVINAGDGSGEHPTQALLDLFTIYENFQWKVPENIAFVGDIKYSRTVHSLVYLLAKLDVETVFHFVCHEKLRPEGEFLRFLEKTNHRFHNDLSSIIGDINVLYVTRLQKERFGLFGDEEHVNAVSNLKSMVVNKDMLSSVVMDGKNDLIVMHPFPRNDELSTDLDDDPRSKYFEQIKNGLYVRMAVMEKVLGSKH